jgi:hypothetical protein
VIRTRLRMHRGCPKPIRRLVGVVHLLMPACLLAPACEGPVVEPLRAPWERMPGEVADPSLAVAPASGDLLLAWVAGGGETWHIWFSRSRDVGSTWSDPVRVTTAPRQAHPHAEASPRLVGAAGNRVALVWTSSIPIEGRRYPASELWAASSHDGGRTWGEPIRVNDDAGGPPQSHTFHGAAWEGDSTLVVAWLDGRGMPRDHGATRADGDRTAGDARVGDDSSAAHAHPSESAVWIARSLDFGRTWSPNLALWPSACPCCRVDLARRSDGRLVAAWREHFEGDVRDVVAAPLPEAGEPPAAPSRVRQDDWVYPACPHSGPAAAIDGSGRLQVTWFTGKPGAAGVFHTRGRSSPPVGAFTDAIALVGGEELPIAHPVAAALADGGAVVAWDVGSDGAREVIVARVASDGKVAEQVVVEASEGADHPRLAAVDQGSVVVAWTVPGERAVAHLARVRFRE